MFFGVGILFNQRENFSFCLQLITKEVIQSRKSYIKKYFLKKETKAMEMAQLVRAIIM